MVEAGHDVFIICASAGSSTRIKLKAPIYELSPHGLDAIVWKSLATEPLIQSSRLERDLKSVLFNQSLKNEGRSILQRERPDLLYERHSLFGWAGVELSQRFGIPLLLEVNAPLCREQAGYERFTLGETAERIETEVLQRADAIIAVSQWLKEWITSKGADERRVHVVPNGISIALFNASTCCEDIRSRYGLVGKRVIGYLGSFQPWHDVDGLLMAFHELYQDNPELRLLLVGNGPRRMGLETTVRRMGLESIAIFTGNVAHDLVPSFIGAMDIAVVPYRMKQDFYFSPLKLFECMVARRPTVAAALGQIEQIIEHGKTGWLYTPGDREKLADGIATLLSSSELASSIAEAARRKVLNEFTWEATAARITHLAQVLIESGRSVSKARA
jgi:glycosyltransferase involved in cell wall biosynthesis